MWKIDEDKTNALSYIRSRRKRKDKDPHCKVGNMQREMPRITFTPTEGLLRIDQRFDLEDETGEFIEVSLITMIYVGNILDTM